MGEPLRIVYIVGSGRSGSTLLDTMLNSAEDVIGVGQLSTNADDHEGACSCGSKDAQSCDFWAKVFALYEERTGDRDKQRLRELEKLFDDNRTLPKVFLRRYSQQDFQEYERLARTQLECIKEISGKEIIIDSSKLVTRLLTLSRMSGLDLTIVHLIRDGRGILWSRVPRSIRDAYSPGDPVRISPGYRNMYIGMRQWMKVNLSVYILKKLGIVKKYALLRYEDLMRNPESEISRIAGHSRVNGARILEILGAGEVFELGHILSGNPTLKKSARIHMDPKKHEKWKYAYPLNIMLLQYIMALPANLLFGYRFLFPEKIDSEKY